MRRSLLALLPLAVLVPRSSRADLVTRWNLEAVDAARTASLGPNPATRTLALVHIAIHDAVATISGAYETYHAQLTLDGGHASRDAAAASAAHQVLVTLFPAQQTALDAAYHSDLAAIADGPDKTSG